MSRLGAVLLAAGGSKRFGADSKLMADLCGRPVVGYAAAAIEAAGVAPRAAVIRPGDQAVRAVVEARGFDVVENPRCEEGMGASIAVGASWAALQDIDGLMICLGDAPLVTPATLGTLAETFALAQKPAVIMTRDGNTVGSPTVFGRDRLAGLAALEGDQGGRAVIRAGADAMTQVGCATPGELEDVDTPEALEAARRRLAGTGV